MAAVNTGAAAAAGGGGPAAPMTSAEAANLLRNVDGELSKTLDEIRRNQASPVADNAAFVDRQLRRIFTIPSNLKINDPNAVHPNRNNLLKPVLMVAIGTTLTAL